MITRTEQRSNFLSKLLAEENVTLQFKHTKTAYFDDIKRVLTLPRWVGMSDHLNDMLIVHEVGHALHSKDWSKLVGVYKNSTIRQIANIIEDYRIDILQKKKYPGSKVDYFKGATEIIEQQHFNIDLSVFHNKCFIDRFHCQTRFFHLLEPSDTITDPEELEFVAKINDCTSTKEAWAVAAEVYDFMKQKVNEPPSENDTINTPENTDDNEEVEETEEIESTDSLNEVEGEESSEGEDETEEGEEGEAVGNEASDDEEDEYPKDSPDNREGGNSDVGDVEPNVETSDINESIANNFLDDEIREIVHSKKQNLLHRVVPVSALKQVLKNKSLTPFSKPQKKKYSALGSLLFKEFSVRKEAKTMNNFTTDRGSIDMDRISMYKISDDIFTSKVQRVSNDDNHRLIMLLDYSGSMFYCGRRGIIFSLDQIAVLRDFCLRAGMPFSVYAFSSTPWAESFDKSLHDRDDHSRECFTTSGVYLYEVINETIKQKEYEKISKALASQRTGLFHPGGTPLLSSLKILNQVVDKMIQSYPDQKINLVVLTDGGDTDYVQGNIFATEDNVEHNISNHKDGHLVYVKTIRSKINSAIGFRLVEKFWDAKRMKMEELASKDLTTDEISDLIEKFETDFQADGFANIELYGYDKYFIVKQETKGKNNPWKNVNDLDTMKDVTEVFEASLKKKKADKIMMKEIAEQLA